ncbi:MAG: hypothetical protein HY689_12350, partial [Chloroflexi bacterium]|nr:hypothetical protein [Chloroflexota bacterium]
FTLIMGYFNLSEYLVIGYKLPEGDDVLLASLFTGNFAGWFWFYIVGGLVVPAVLVFIPWPRPIPAILLAAVLVDIAMWIERFLILVGTFSVPLMPYEPDTYLPTWVEIAITAAAFAGFSLIITIFSRLVPVISVWEVKEQDEQALSRERAPEPVSDVPELATRAHP